MRFSGPWFTLAFAVAYPVAFVLDLTLFLYYPLEREFRLAADPAMAGPAMHWYGLLATAALAALAAAWLLPGRWLSPRVLGFAWLAPVVCMAVIAWGLRPFFFA